jgi:hypothetical protein
MHNMPPQLGWQERVPGTNEVPGSTPGGGSEWM